jgi:alpha-tubulin suppressor-like RCC1 family protein
MEALDDVRKRGINSFKALDDESGTIVYVFGQNSYGELGIGDLDERHVPTKLSLFDNIDISQVAAGNEHTVVLTKSGQVYTFGFNGSGQLGHGNTKSYHLPRLVETLNDTKIAFIASANG